MKDTLRSGNIGKNDKDIGKDFYDFHDKVNKILEDQEEVFAIHMASIKVE